MSTPARLNKVEPVPSASEKIQLRILRMKFTILSVFLFVTREFQKNEPVRLARKEESSNFAKLKGYLLLAALCTGLFLFVAVCFAVVPPVESGVYYNHL